MDGQTQHINISDLEHHIQPHTKPKFNPLKNKKILLLSGVILLIFLVLIAILYAVLKPKTKPPVNQPVTLNFWGTSVDDEAMKEIIANFETQNPLIKIKYEKQLLTGYDDRVKTRLQLNNASALPDILEMDTTLLDEVYGNLSPIQDKSILSKYSSTSVRNNSVNTTTYAVPYKFDSLALAYNQQYLSEISLNETDFNKLDWSSLVIRAQKLTKTQKIKVNNKDVEELIRGGIAIGSPANVTNAEKILQLLLIQDDANIYDPKKRVFDLGDKFNDDLKFYTNFALNNVWNDKLPNDIEAFTQGKVAMVLVRSQDIDQIKSRNPNLKFVTVLPARIGVIKNISLSNSLALPRVKKNQTQALKFLEYLSRTEVGNSMFNLKNTNTFIPSQLESLNQIPKESHFSVFSSLDPTAEKFITPDYTATSKIMNTYLTDIFKDNYSRLQPGDKLKEFRADPTPLERNLNEFIKAKFKTTPTATAK